MILEGGQSFLRDGIKVGSPAPYLKVEDGGGRNFTNPCFEGASHTITDVLDQTSNQKVCTQSTKLESYGFMINTVCCTRHVYAIYPSTLL